MNTLIDTYGRVHRNLRVSLTDRCNLRCTYCMPNDFAAWLPSEHQLTTDELVRVIEIAVSEGINEVRLTGGEPLLRPDIVEIVSRINAITNAPTLTMTTNALTLAKVAQPLVDAGLTRINISLDTLDRDRFKLMTHRDRIDDVFAGIKAAHADEAPALLEWALANNLALRFIEQMPLDAGGIWERSALVTADDIYADLSTRYQLTPCDDRGSSPAEEFFVNGGPATVGIIGSVTRPFCGACDRLRLTSDGQLRSCLFSLEEMELRTAMRNGASDEDIAQRFRITVAGKLPGHGINDPKFIQPQRPMSAIGG
jgi:cyclic pyranopterin phosphate synthase